MKNIKIYILLFLILTVIDVKAEIIDIVKGLSDKQNIVIDDLNSVQRIFNTSAATANIKECLYSANSICKIRIRERMPAVIKLGTEIRTIVLGDPNNFSAKIVDSSKKLLRIKGSIPGADTNLTLADEHGKLISFYIRIDSIKSEHPSDFVVNVVDKNKAKDNKEYNPDKQSKVDIKADKNNKKDNLFMKKPSIKPSDINTSYKVINGNKSILPINIFDDGSWTYFKYSNTDDLSNVKVLPAIFEVVDGYDSPVNTKIIGGSLVAETVSKKWTIRVGNKHACIRKL